jgi:hypothetical protein
MCAAPGRWSSSTRRLADRLFPGIDPIGRRVAWTGDVLRFIGIPENDWRTVVGIVGDTKDGGLDAPPTARRPSSPFAQAEFPPGGLVIRSAVDPGRARPPPPAPSCTIHRARAAGRERACRSTAVRDESVGPRRLNALLRRLDSASSRSSSPPSASPPCSASQCECAHERDRHPHGARRGRRRRVTAMILSEGGLLVGLGLLALAQAGALALARSIEGLLYGVTARDPAHARSMVAGTMMGAIGLAACWVPGRARQSHRSKRSAALELSSFWCEEKPQQQQHCRRDAGGAEARARQPVAVPQKQNACRAPHLPTARLCASASPRLQFAVRSSLFAVRRPRQAPQA